MAVVLKTGTITSGVVDIVKTANLHTSRFGLMLNGNFDSGQFNLLFGIPGNHQFPKPFHIGSSSSMTFNLNGLFYIEGFCEEIDIRIQNGLGSEDVDYVLFVGERP